MAQGLASGVSGYLACHGKPIAAFVYEEDAQASPASQVIRQTWDNLWNQGLASILVFHCPDKVLVYSLTPPDDPDKNVLSPVEAVELAAIGLEAFKSRCRDMVWKLEDGRYYEEHRERFVASSRVDKRLLGNMECASGRLQEMGLSSAQAQALLLQTLFIAYLEDRGILQQKDVQGAAGYENLRTILERRDVLAFQALFDDLAVKFNGDVFSSPCCFRGKEKVQLKPEHLDPLLDFRGGRIDSRRSQRSILPLYNFRFIPVELLSAIYDKFQNPETQRQTGGYFTPAYLAQACLDMAWKYLSTDQALSPSFRILDPACGSAVFLVCAFQRLVGLALATEGVLEWGRLLELLHQLHGIDRNGDAIRVGVISLYIALLERSDPPSISSLMAKGRLLPRLLGKTMFIGDFFDDISDGPSSFGLIIGNPPWVSRNVATLKSSSWCKTNGFKAPGGSTVWGFLWKSGRMLQQNGVVALLVDAKILFNLQAEEARRQLFATFHIPLVVNFADACFQLFEGAEAPAALCLLQPQSRDRDKSLAQTEYWSPKANPVFSVNQRITLSPEDRTVIKQWRLEQDSSLLKRHRWGRSRDISLLYELKRFPLLAERMAMFKEWRQKQRPDVPWWIGQGYQPCGENDAPKRINGLTKQLFVDAKSEKQKWILPPILNFGNSSDEVRRTGIVKQIVEGVFSPPMILLKQGVKRGVGLPQAVYTEQCVTFVDSIQAIVSVKGTEDATAFKILTAVLNSRFAAWFFFHTCAVQGVERDKIHEREILTFPFPMPEESDDPEAILKIIAMLDELAHGLQTQRDLVLHNPIEFRKEWESQLNELVYRYYGLTKHERQVVEDAFCYIIPSMQPREKDDPFLWRPPKKEMLREYALYLQEGLAANYQAGTKISVSVFGGNCGLALAELTRGEADDVRVETSDAALLRRLDILREKWPREIGGGVHQLLEMTFALGNKLYLIKPNRVRHWMPSSALCDVDRIVSQLSLVGLGRQMA
jgi:hypothetical protein